MKESSMWWRKLQNTGESFLVSYRYMPCCVGTDEEESGDCRKPEDFARDMCKAVERHFGRLLPYKQVHRYRYALLRWAPFTSVAVMRNYNSGLGRQDVDGMCLLTWLRGGNSQVTAAEIRVLASFWQVDTSSIGGSQCRRQCACRRWGVGTRQQVCAVGLGH